MACSSPLRMYPKSIKQSINSNRDVHFYTQQALQNSYFNHVYYTVPCGWCLNCRIDKMNELSDRCEYEYINYGCGAFVTFTFDDYHLNPYQFINSKTGQVTATLSKRCAKKFLDRLNKQVHQYCKKYGLTPFCRPDYKYLLVGEYGENGSQFDRPHFHCLFFGLDFAMCERLFWRAWQFQGSIQVGAIRNGGIGYVVSYLDKQIYGHEAWLKYDYNYLQRPFQFHSVGLGEGLYKSQLKYIKEHDGCYNWHAVDRPVPAYYKNKYLITSDKTIEAMRKKYVKSIQNIENLYNVKIHSFKELEKFKLDKAQILQKMREIKLVQNGKVIRDDNLINRQAEQIRNNHRLPTLFDKQFIKVIDVSGEHKFKIDHRLKDLKDLNLRDWMKLHTDPNTLYHRLYDKFGVEYANRAFGLEGVPF